MVVFWSSSFYRAKVVVYGQKWIYPGKIGFIRAKVVDFGQGDCIWAKVNEFGQSGCTRAKAVVFVFRTNICHRLF